MNDPSPPPLPQAFSRLVRGYGWQRVAVGKSAATVYRLSADGKPALYLKATGPTPEPALELTSGLSSGLSGEVRRLRWLEGKLPVPRVVAFSEDARSAFLLTTALEGKDASDPSHRGGSRRLVRGLAAGLRRIHALPVQGCPFDHRLARELERARARLEAGSVDEDDFDDERRGLRAEEIFRRLLAERPADEDLVFTHGDYSLPNVILQGDELAGFVDVGRAGVGDRSRDLALAARSLAYNWGEAWVPLFFEAYGLEGPDAAKLAFYRGLDEFF